MAVTSKTVRVIGHRLFSVYSSGTTTIGVSCASTYTWFLEELRLNLSTGQASGSTFVATINSAMGALHDTIILKRPMSKVQDLQYIPQYKIRLDAEDTIDIAWVNNTTNAWGLNVIISKE